MKKLISALLTLILVLAFVPVVSADQPMKPVIIEEPPNSVLLYLNEPYTFNCKAQVTDGGNLSYTWYVANFPAVASITGSLGKGPQLNCSWNSEGVKYVVCEVINEKGGVKSEPTYTSFTTVNVNGQVPDPIINSEMPDCYMPVNDTVHLWTDVSPSPYGPQPVALFYQWYRETPDGQLIKIPDAQESMLVVSENYPTINYYFCIILANDGINSSGNIQTRKVRVEFFNTMPAAPTINSEMPDCNLNVGDTVTLWTDASSPDGGELSYIWYKSDTPQMMNIRAIDNATGKDYTVTSNTPSVAYYCCGIRNENNGYTSDPTYTRLIKVEFSLPPVKNPIINKKLSDVTASVGETVTLSCDAS